MVILIGVVVGHGDDGGFGVILGEGRAERVVVDKGKLVRREG